MVEQTDTISSRCAAAPLVISLENARADEINALDDLAKLLLFWHVLPTPLTAWQVSLHAQRRLQARAQ